MDAKAAREVLGVGGDATIGEIRSRYRKLAKESHPDVPGTGDAQRFVLISTAYLVVQKHLATGDGPRQTAEDIEFAVNVRREVDAHIDSLVSEFKAALEAILDSTERRVSSVIRSSGSTAQLKTNLETRVAKCLTDAKTQVEFRARRLAKSIGSEGNEFVFGLFRDMYRERRRYWLVNLYRNPVTILETAGLGLLYFLKNFPDLTTPVPAVRQIASIWWLPVAFLSFGVFIVGMQYLLLNPKRQFLPPSLSLGEIHSLVKEQSGQIGSTPKENGGTGVFTGLLIGSAVLPGLGTLVGGLLGAIGFLFGESLEKQKDRVRGEILRELEEGADQIRDSLDSWARVVKRDLHRAVVESFSRNCIKVAGLLSRGQIGPAALPAATKLLKR